MIITAKDISNRLNVSRATAYKYLNDMLSYYNPPSNKITESHFNDYFAIPKG